MIVERRLTDWEGYCLARAALGLALAVGLWEAAEPTKPEPEPEPEPDHSYASRLSQVHPSFHFFLSLSSSSSSSSSSSTPFVPCPHRRISFVVEHAQRTWRWTRSR